MNKENGERTPDVKPKPSDVFAASAGQTSIRRILSGFSAALGIGKSRIQTPVADTMDTGTRLAHERTSLAIERTYWAAERTLMGWIRTALAMISFGFTIGKLGQTLQDIQVKGLRGMRMIGIDSIAYFLVILGTIALLAAVIQFSGRVHNLSEKGLKRQPSIEFAVALVLSLMGIIAFSTLVMKI